MADREFCNCRSCDPVNTEAICQSLAQTMTRYNDSASQTASIANANNVSLQHQYTSSAQNAISGSQGDKLISQLASLMALRNPGATT